MIPPLRIRFFLPSFYKFIFARIQPDSIVLVPSYFQALWPNTKNLWRLKVFKVFFNALTIL